MLTTVATPTSRRTQILIALAAALLAMLGLSTVDAPHAEAATHPRITAVTPRSGPLAAGNQVVIDGAGFGSDTSVTFGKADARHVAVTSNHQLTATVPRHRAGTVTVRLRTGHGTSPANASAKYTFAKPPAHMNATGRHAVTGPGHPDLISCATASFCAASTGNGYLTVTKDGTHWTQPVPRLDSGHSAISCASATSCVALSSYSSTWTEFNGTSWSKTAYFDSAKRHSARVSLSCPTAKFCIAAEQDAGKQYWYTFDGSHWKSLAAPKGTAFGADVSCASATFCMTVSMTSANAFATYDGARWTTGTLPAGLHGGDNVSCAVAASGRLCAVVRWDRGVATYRDGRWSAVTRLGPADSYAIGQLSCATESFCMLTTDDTAGPGTDSYLSSAVAVAFTAVSCASSKLCVAITAHGTASTFYGTSWTKQRTVDSHATGKTKTSAVACVPSLCIVVDSAGYATASHNGTTWSTPRRIYPHGALTGVSCTPARLCFAVGGNSKGGVAVEYTHGTWRGFHTVDRGGPLRAVSCVSYKFCAAATTTGVREWGGRSWSGNIVYHIAKAAGGNPSELASLSCTSSRFCLATGGADKWNPWATEIDGASSRVVAGRNMTDWLDTYEAPIASCTANFKCNLINYKAIYHFAR